MFYQEESKGSPSNGVIVASDATQTEYNLCCILTGSIWCTGNEYMIKIDTIHSYSEKHSGVYCALSRYILAATTPVGGT